MSTFEKKKLRKMWRMFTFEKTKQEKIFFVSDAIIKVDTER